MVRTYSVAAGAARSVGAEHHGEVGVELPPVIPAPCSEAGQAHDERGGRATGPRVLASGEPFAEPLVMWWNFVGRSHEEVVEARTDWEAGRRFGTVAGYTGTPLPAPAMPTVRLKARDRNGTTTA
jgi:hypothetical protein